MMIGQNDDNERIAKKAHELWEAEGRPHGRDRSHWDQAKEIVALQDSEGTTLLPRDTGANAPVEEKSVAIDNEGEFPNLTDTGEHDLTSIEREPAVTAPTSTAPGAGSMNVDASPAPKTAGAPAPAPKAVSKKVSAGADAAKSEKLDKRANPATKGRGGKK
jgi:hypothetical protein